MKIYFPSFNPVSKCGTYGRSSFSIIVGNSSSKLGSLKRIFASINNRTNYCGSNQTCLNNCTKNCLTQSLTNCTPYVLCKKYLIKTINDNNIYLTSEQFAYLQNNNPHNNWINFLACYANSQYNGPPAGIQWSESQSQCEENYYINCLEKTCY